MATYSVRAAKAQFSRLLRDAESGEDVRISRHGRTIARLVAIRHAPVRRKFGALRGQLSVGPEFFAPLTPDKLPR